MIVCPQCHAKDTLETMELNGGYLVYCVECEYSSDVLLDFPLFELDLVLRVELRETDK